MDATRSAWLSSALSLETDECILWPFATNKKGYGIVRVNRRRMTANHYICWMTNGERPTEKHTDTAHSCGVRRCCNKRHIRYATSKENSLDSIEHGTMARGRSNGQARLTENDVRQIRSEIGRRSLRSIAAQYGVTHKAISFIRDGVTWASLP